MSKRGCTLLGERQHTPEFALTAISAALLGQLADVTSVETVYRLCALLPLLGLLTWFLPDIEGKRASWRA